MSSIPSSSTNYIASSTTLLNICILLLVLSPGHGNSCQGRKLRYLEQSSNYSPPSSSNSISYTNINAKQSHAMKINSTLQNVTVSAASKLLPTFRQLMATSQYIIVDIEGKGQFRSIQAAIDAVPEYNTRWVYIQINAGIYNEKVSIPFNKPYITLQGAGSKATIINWNDRASNLGTANSATFSANSHSFIAKGIGFKNSAPPPAPGSYGGQAVAALLNGDMMAFYECGFYGAQDTLFDYEGRHYFKNCYIQGTIDFIFGHGQSLYKDCQLVVTAQSGYLSGSITAQNRKDPNDPGGFVFDGCSIVGTGEVYLGRAWGAYSRVVFLNTFMSNIIVPDGWYDWGQPSRRETVFYAQYSCTGPGADTRRRVPWSHQLSAAEAQPFLELSFIDAGNWLQET